MEPRTEGDLGRDFRELNAVANQSIVWDSRGKPLLKPSALPKAPIKPLPLNTSGLKHLREKLKEHL
jgi:hypothetical protein